MVFERNNMDEVMSSPAWARALYGIRSIPAESWQRLLSRHLKVAELVLEGHSAVGNSSHGQDPMQEISQGRHPTPLHAAASQGILRAGALLLAMAPGDVDVRDAGGRTALHWAAVTGQTEFMQMLLLRGASVDARDNFRRTPLLVCSAFAVPDATGLLVEWGANPNLEDKMGLTPLHACAGTGDIVTAEILLAAGADIRRRSSMGAIPRNIAERWGHEAMVQLLAAQGSSGGYNGSSSSSSSSSSDSNSNSNESNVDDWCRFDLRSMLQGAPRH